MSAKLKADYLVVGTGAVGMAFVDALIADSDARVVMIDRRHAPGGHWHDAYSFVRLHQPSAYYGVNSLPLGEDRIDRSGTNAGLLERASAPEICGYYARVMEHCLVPSGRVEHHPLCEHLGDNRFVSHVTGTQYEVEVGKAVVDANYLCPAVPATTPPPFDVAAGARCIAVGELSRLSEAPSDYVIIGAGKTAMDACLWLLQNDVATERIRWIKPRESWLVNREFVQSGELVGSLIGPSHCRVCSGALRPADCCCALIRASRPRCIRLPRSTRTSSCNCGAFARWCGWVTYDASSAIASCWKAAASPPTLTNSMSTVRPRG